MRFTLIKDLKQDAAMKPILSALLIFTLLYLVSDIFVKQSHFGISVEMINLTLFGSEEDFIDPISKSSFLEFWHIEIFFIMMILLTLSAVYLRVSQKNKKQIIITNITMISSIISLIAILISFFVTKIFVEIYLLCFFIWHISALYMALYSLWRLHFAKSI